MDARPEDAPSADTSNQQSQKEPPRPRFQFSNVILNSPTFNDFDGDLKHYHIRDTSETGLHLLRMAASLGAIHDSSERFPAEEVIPGTQESTLKAILDWIKDPNPPSHVFCLYGSPSEGTTAVLQSIAETCASSDELKSHLGGSFFFSKNTARRDKGHYLFLTIAYQLAMNVPVLRDPINRIICANPSLTTKSISVQLESLIVRVFQSFEFDPQLSITVIIDGLDQCQDNDTQLLILRLIADIVTGQKAPLRFLIGTRPKSHIRVAFDEPILQSITQTVFLNSAYDRKQSACPQNGGRLNSDDSTKIRERSKYVVYGPGSDYKVIISGKKLAFLEQSLGDLKLMHVKLIEKNRTLNVEIESLERRLKIRDERIQILEALLRDADILLDRQIKVFKARLHEVKERLDRVRGEIAQAAEKTGHNQGNTPSSGPSENPTEDKGAGEARNLRASWFFSHAGPSSEGNRQEGASDFHQYP